MTEPKESSAYKYCNHHHVPTASHDVVDFGHGTFVANKKAIPLLKALNELGLRTRTHHITDDDHAFVSILLDGQTSFEVRKVFENAADRTCYNGETELLISWRLPV
jgi:hypothetical protein